MPLSDEAKWEVYCTWIAATEFRDGERPDVEKLVELLQGLGVTIDQLEIYVGKSAGL